MSSITFNVYTIIYLQELHLLVKILNAFESFFVESPIGLCACACQPSSLPHALH
jgi:hypothetical protein